MKRRNFECEAADSARGSRCHLRRSNRNRAPPHSDGRLPQPNTPPDKVPRQPQGAPKLQVMQADLAAEGDQRFFTSAQFAALEKLGGILKFSR